MTSRQRVQLVAFVVVLLVIVTVVYLWASGGL